MTKRLGVALSAALAVAGLALAGCAAPKEVAGPTEMREMASGGGIPVFFMTTTRREGVRQPFLLLRPARPSASVILLNGGSGVVGIGPDGIRNKGNFLVRSRALFAQQGLLVAIVDPPSDRADLTGFRISQAHALDLKGVIAALRELAPVPVWLVGTSRGTISAAKVADWLADGGGPDGVVLTSSLFVASRREVGSVFDADPARVRVPLLVVHHRTDRCHATPFAQAEPYVKRMVNAQPAELIAFEGGGPVDGDVCEPRDYHGFPGLEPQVVEAIARWIKAHPPR